MTGEKLCSRRNFVKGAAALGALTVLSGCATGALNEDKDLSDGAGNIQTGVTEIRHAFCQMCGPARTGCSTLCYINDGVWTNVEGNPDSGNNWGRGSKSLCPKGNAAMQTIYSPIRITHPMKRTGAKGEGKFEQCSWDEAMQIIVDKMKDIRETDPAGYAVLSPQYYAVLATFGRRFLNVFGSPNYLHSAICNSQRSFSRQVTIGGPTHGQANNTAPGQLNKTQLFVSWGFNSENSAINQGNPNGRLSNMERGMQTIDIRPMQDALASHADIWVPVRPGTDAALALAILNYIISNDLYDHDFVDNWTNGFDKLAEHIKQYTPDWAANITGLPVEQITQIANMMGTIKPMGIMMGNGIGDQTNDGHDTIAAVCLIEAITGNMGIAGGAMAGMIAPDPIIKTGNVDLLADKMIATDEDLENGFHPGVSSLAGPETPRWFQAPHTWESGPTGAYYKSLMSILDEDHPHPIRAVFGQSSNPFGATRQPKNIAKALEKLEFYFVMDPYWNSSCDYADVVLPACSNYETSEQFAARNAPDGAWIGINQKIQEPLGESRSDWQFYLDLAVGLGFGDDFWGGDMDACLTEQLEGSGFTLEDLRAANTGIFVERTDGSTPKEPEYQNYEKMFEVLPGGKVQCYNEWLGGKPNSLETGALSFLPTYKGPPEGIAETPDLVAEFPLILTDVHAYRLCNHSYYVDVPYLRELQPYPWAKINPKTAQQYGIADGDWMRVESPHGWVKLVAKYFEGISPEVLMCRRGWWQACEELGLEGYGTFDGGGDITVLYNTDIEKFDEFHSAMNKQTLVKISKL